MATAVLVVGAPGSLTAGEQFLKTRLQNNLGLTVVEHDDNNPVYSGSAAVILIPESTSSSLLTTKYKDDVRGIVIFEQGIWDDMALTGNTAWSGVSTSTWSVAAGATNHPIASGVPSTFDMYTSAQTTQVVNPATGMGSGAVSVIIQPSRTDRSAVFAYETGALDVNGVGVKGRRVCFGTIDSVITNLKTDGLKVLDNAVLWAGNLSAPNLLIETGQAADVVGSGGFGAATGFQRQSGNGTLDFYPILGSATGQVVGAVPTYSWTYWNGSAEQPLTLDGVWNGSSTDSVTTEIN